MKKLKSRPYFFGIIDNKISEKELNDFLNILIEEENYEYASMVKEMIDIGHFDNDTDLNIKDSEATKKRLFSALDGLSETIKEFGDDDSADNSDDDDNEQLEGLLGSLNKLEKFLDDMKKKSVIENPKFITEKNKKLFQLKVDELTKE